MRRKIKSLAAVLLMSILVAGTFTACSSKSSDENTNQNGNTETTDTEAENKDLSGTVSMAGSTSMEKLANYAAEAFMTKYPNVTVTAEFTGSSAGVEAVTNGTVDIGNSSRSLKESETSAGVVENIVAIDGIGVIIDKANAVTNLTKDQLVQIYTGAVTNWSEVGGSDQPIVVIGRESGSGTRGAFEELLAVEDACKYSNEINSTGGVMAKVASTPGAIGYVSIDILDDSVIAINIDGIEPTEEKIKAGEYLLSRPFVMATKGEISEQSEAVQTFFEYMMSDEGKELIKSAGLITVD